MHLIIPDKYCFNNKAIIQKTFAPEHYDWKWGILKSEAFGNNDGNKKLFLFLWMWFCRVFSGTNILKMPFRHRMSEKNLKHKSHTKYIYDFSWQYDCTWQSGVDMVRVVTNSLWGEINKVLKIRYCYYMTLFPDVSIVCFGYSKWCNCSRVVY